MQVAEKLEMWPLLLWAIAVLTLTQLFCTCGRSLLDMATTKDVTRLPSGRLKYRGETFSGYNKPKKTPGKSKKSAVLAKKGNEVKLVRFGDPNMSIKKSQPGRRSNFRARHNCDTAKDKFTARYWSCKAW